MKRFQLLKGFVLGVTFCALVCVMCVPGFAASVNKQLNAYYNDIKLVINGENVIPKDVNGKVVEPFIIDGTTFLPVRAVAEALGQNVSWDGATQTVIIGANEEYDQPTIWLDAMHPTNDGFELVSEEFPVKDNLDASYKSYMYGGSRATYALNGQYEHLTGRFIVRQGQEVYGCQRLKVLVDDKVVYTSEPVVKGSLPIDFEVDVSGGLTMTLMLEWDMSYDSLNFTHGHVHNDFAEVNSKAYTYYTAIVNAGLWAE